MIGIGDLFGRRKSEQAHPSSLEAWRQRSASIWPSRGQSLQVRMEWALHKRQAAQRPFHALAAGAATAAICLVIWGVCSWKLASGCGWMAIVMGVAVGLAMRLVGRGIDRTLGLEAAGLTLAGWVIGICLAACAVFAARETDGWSLLAEQGAFQNAWRLSTDVRSGLDLLYILASAAAAFFLAYERMTPQKLRKLAEGDVHTSP